MTQEQNEYWNGTGRLQREAEVLMTEVPDEGSVEDSTRPMLEQFRRAVNIYYDLHNNGLCNITASEVRSTFSCTVRTFRNNSNRYMDGVVMNAYHESVNRNPSLWDTARS
jgi:hypothetical protein